MVQILAPLVFPGQTLHIHILFYVPGKHFKPSLMFVSKTKADLRAQGALFRQAQVLTLHLADEAFQEQTLAYLAHSQVKRKRKTLANTDPVAQPGPRVTRLGDFSPIGLRLEAHYNFLKR